MPRSTTWREKLRPQILQTIEENRGKPEKEIRAALRAVYPFSRKYGPAHQYKIWCDEVNVQLGKKKAKGEKMNNTKKKAKYPHTVEVDGVRFNYGFGASYALIETAEGQHPHLCWAPALTTQNPHIDVNNAIRAMLQKLGASVEPQV